MNKKIIPLFCILSALTILSTRANACEGCSAPLFNELDLSGWHNPYPHGEARVVDGVIELVGDKKFFLVTDEQYEDFEFIGEVKLPEGQANSGFMFRAQKKADGSLFGYQAEVDGAERRWSGGLFDEARRSWIHPKKPIENNPYNDEHWTEERRNAFKRDDWNQYKIRCEGNHIQIWVNGVLTTDLRDDADRKGYIGLQHHGEAGQIYRFRKLAIKKIGQAHTDSNAK